MGKEVNRKTGRAVRELPEGGSGGQSVFKMALEGLEKIQEKKFSDMEMMAAAISVAESLAGFSTGEMETVIKLGKGKFLTVSQEEAKGIKLLVTFLKSQGMVENLADDKWYREVDMEAASEVEFLEGKSDAKKSSWVRNYNNARNKALAEVEKKFIRTWKVEMDRNEAQARRCFVSRLKGNKASKKITFGGGFKRSPWFLPLRSFGQ